MLNVEESQKWNITQRFSKQIGYIPMTRSIMAIKHPSRSFPFPFPFPFPNIAVSQTTSTTTTKRITRTTKATATPLGRFSCIRPFVCNYSTRKIPVFVWILTVAWFSVIPTTTSTSMPISTSTTAASSCKFRFSLPNYSNEQLHSNKCYHTGIKVFTHSKTSETKLAYPLIKNLRE